jgi:hypothetical protein
MCHNCKYAKRIDIHYICEYRCELLNGITSEIVDTYFNESDQKVKCPKIK